MNRLMKKCSTSLTAAILAAALTPAPALSADPACYRVNVATGVLRVREGPSTDYGIIGELQRGDEVCPLRTVDGWAEFRFGDDGKGYVSAEFLYSCPVKSGPLQTQKATFLREECGDFCWSTFRLASGKELRLQGTVEEVAPKEGARVSISYRKVQFWENNIDDRSESMCVRVEVLQSIEVIK